MKYLNLRHIYLFCLFFYSCGDYKQKYVPKKIKNNDPLLYLPDYRPGQKVEVTGDYIFSQDMYEEFLLWEFPKEIKKIEETYHWPIWLNIDLEKGKIFGTPNEFGMYKNISIQLLLNDGQKITYGPFSIGVKGDPLKQFSWGIENHGQEVFSFYGGIAGIDINSTKLYRQQIFGDGVKIVVSDTGIEKNHDDYYENFNLSLSKNYKLKAPYFGDPVPMDPHGTAVAGIIASRGWNNIGIRGVAPKAQISGYQFLFSNQTTDMLIDQASGPFDIFNYSYGDKVFHDVVSNADYINHLEWMTKNARDGRGALFVKGAGNEFKVCSGSTCAGHNSNIALENENPYFIVVGAINSYGQRASYSSAGSNLWIAAPGGEYGIMYPAIITTDLPSCEFGYSSLEYASYGNEFEYEHALNPYCLFTSMMNGTSAAVPFVSGSLALLIEKFPHFSWRDLRHIITLGAKKIDVNNSDNKHPGFLDLENHTYEQGWVINGAGISFHNWYGFGLIDVYKSSQIGESHQLLSEFIQLNKNFSKSKYAKNNLNLTIPDNNSSGLKDSISISDNLIVEQVQLELNINHPRSGEVGIELTSPMGTKSILMNINNSLILSGDSNLTSTRLLSNAFYNEISTGTWELKLIDGSPSNTGTLIDWKINILGRNP